MRRALTLQDRVVAYMRSDVGQKYPDSVPCVSLTGRWLYATWSIGALFMNPTRYPGCYPRGYIERVRGLFPDVATCRILHLFSGSIPADTWTRLDLCATARKGNRDFVPPDIVGSVYDLPALLAAHPRRGPFRLVMADPSYPGQGRKLYGTSEIDVAKTFRAIAAAVAPGTHVAWLSTAMPSYRKEQWRRYGAISIERSGGQAYRKVQLFERRNS